MRARLAVIGFCVLGWALCGCGSDQTTLEGSTAPTLANPNPLPDADAGNRPIADFDTPARMTLECTGDVERLQFELPCQLGMNLSGGGDGLGANALECHPTAPASGLLSLFATLAPNQVGEPLDIASVLSRVGDSTLKVAGQDYKLQTMVGRVIFSSIEERRAFVGQFPDIILDFLGSGDHRITCHGTDAAFWAEPGDFL